MTKPFILVLSVVACLKSFAFGSSPTALDMLLKSPEVSERRAAYLEILKKPDEYTEQILRGIDSWQKTKELGEGVLDKFIYLAAVLKRDAFF